MLTSDTQTIRQKCPAECGCIVFPNNSHLRRNGVQSEAEHGDGQKALTHTTLAPWPNYNRFTTASSYILDHFVRPGQQRTGPLCWYKTMLAQAGGACFSHM